jgi:hypothetical protein
VRAQDIGQHRAMHMLVAAWLLVGTAETAAPPAPEAPVAVEAGAVDDGPDLGAIGLVLTGGGAALATGTVVASTLIESLNTPDQEGQPRNEKLIQGSGLVATGLVSIGAAAMLTGAALLIDDVVFAPARAAQKPAE